MLLGCCYGMLCGCLGIIRSLLRYPRWLLKYCLWVAVLFQVFDCGVVAVVFHVFAKLFQGHCQVVDMVSMRLLGCC